MKKYLLMVCVFLGCSSSFVKRRTHLKSYLYLPPICSEQVERVKDNFFYDAAEKHFVLNWLPLEAFFHDKTEYLSGVRKACVNLLTTSEIRDIFGKPSEETPKGLYYDLDNQVHPMYKVRWTLAFFNDDNNKIAFIRVGYNQIE